MDAVGNILEQEKTPEHCKYCGRAYVKKPIYLKDGEKIVRTMFLTVPDCTCEAHFTALRAEEAKRQKEAERQQKELEEKRNQARMLFVNSCMTPFFAEKRFGNLEQTPEIKTLQEYAKRFKPAESSGIQLIGTVGTGKSTALAALCNELLESGYNCLFTPFSTLLDKFSSASFSNHGDITNLLDWLCTFDFVVLDDIGRENYTEKRKETSFRIIDALHNNKVVTAFTANPEMIVKLKSIQEWAAAIDRLREMCKLKFVLKGASRRSGT